MKTPKVKVASTPENKNSLNNSKEDSLITVMTKVEMNTNSFHEHNFNSITPKEGGKDHVSVVFLDEVPEPKPYVPAFQITDPEALDKSADLYQNCFGPHMNNDERTAEQEGEIYHLIFNNNAPSFENHYITFSSGHNINFYEDRLEQMSSPNEVIFSIPYAALEKVIKNINDQYLNIEDVSTNKIGQKYIEELRENMFALKVKDDFLPLLLMPSYERCLPSYNTAVI